jgi:deoxyribodipyrimidine photolyase-related protein
MKQGEPFLYHSIISPYLNCGLLEAREICVAAERAYQKGNAPLNAVEGFIRQILGWREYVRGIYWLKMPHYATTNALEAKRPLPSFFWTAETQMNCIAQVVRETSAHAYAHHIQRLMVTGNFALLAGLAPKEVEAWYLSVYADAFDWVELPNVHGMVMFADHGLLASKPYAASGAYIHRMSDYCTHCHYKVADKSGKDACPFNLLYWNFLIENESKLARNPRMAMPYRNLKNMDATRREEIEREASAFLASMYDAPTKPVQASLDL